MKATVASEPFSNPLKSHRHDDAADPSCLKRTTFLECLTRWEDWEKRCDLELEISDHNCVNVVAAARSSRDSSPRIKVLPGL